jgi:AcrR family transcriptional regulator
VNAPRWTRLEHDERREQILAAARRLFSERAPGSVSTTEIAREAGVARGLLHHYFGTKRDLYLEVMRSMLRFPALPEPDPGDDAQTVLDDSIDRWLTMVERNREAWLAALGAQGLGRDPEVEAILEESREESVDRLAAVVAPGEASLELRALLRAYAGFAEAAGVEWLVRARLDRAQVRELLLSSLLTLVRSVLPALERARPRSPIP